MSVKRRVRKAFAFVFAKEATFAKSYVINLIAGTSSIQLHPRLVRLLPFSIQHISSGIRSLTTFVIFHDRSHISRTYVNRTVLSDCYNPTLDTSFVFGINPSYKPDHKLPLDSARLTVLQLLTCYTT